nr:PREDICTED: DDB1- and CUL4-associated factor 10 isoform X2 [Megachile rotundata]
MPKIKTRQANSLWLRQRELGIRFPLGHADCFHRTLYSSIQPVTSWDHALSDAAHGGVFNLEYSPDGSLLLAACEKKSILMFDPLSRRLIHAIDNAHDDCVNCVRFLDQRMFATCSDDSTVALWDARNLKQRIKTLQGHSNWVKNIEYSPKDSLLLTSGFDGSIYTWDINSFTENNILHTRVFHTNGLMRTRLSPDASKMLISTTSGYLIIIHNLKLSTLTQDLAGFRWTCVHDIQERDVSCATDQSREEEETTSQFNEVPVEEFEDFPQPQSSRSGITSSFLIESPNNRVRVVHTTSDTRSNSVGSSDNAQSVRLSRNNWQPTFRRASRLQLRNLRLDRYASRTNFNTVEAGSGSGASSDSRVSADRDNRQENRYMYGADNNESMQEDASSDQDRDSSLYYWLPRPNSHLNYLRPRNMIDDFSTGNIELHVSTTDVWEAHVAVREARLRRERHRDARSNNNAVVIISDRIRVQNRNRQGQRTMFAIPRNRMIHQNTPRLTHYIEEPNVGSGYIKELCFSADGRLICSPFGYGVRLLSFSSDCSELSNCVPPFNESVQLHELAANISHTGIVVSTKFSPRHCLLVSGCLGGTIVWHQPVV